MTVKLTIIKLAKEQIPTSHYFKSAKEIFIFLTKHFKLPDQEVREMIHKHYHNL